MSLQGHKKRILVALIALPLLVLLIVKLPAYFFLALLTVVCAVGMWEFLKMYKTHYFWIGFGVLSSVILFLLNCFYPQLALHYYATAFVVITTTRLITKKNPQHALSEISSIMIGLLYIPALLAFQWFLRNHGWQWIIYLYAVVWSADSFAYYIGKGFGKKKLYPEVSPKKTWAGAYGSLIGGMIASLLFGHFLLSKPLIKLLIAGFLIGFISIFGDLVESMFKREAQVKDSSFLFPEHGGVLDKIDSMLFAGVLVYFFMKLM
ncbi:phosphatidate cytidylyltransferase [Thermodesulfovibrio sp. TK110]